MFVCFLYIGFKNKVDIDIWIAKGIEGEMVKIVLNKSLSWKYMELEYIHDGKYLLLSSLNIDN